MSREAPSFSVNARPRMSASAVSSTDACPGAVSAKTWAIARRGISGRSKGASSARCMAASRASTFPPLSSRPGAK